MSNNNIIMGNIPNRTVSYTNKIVGSNQLSSIFSDYFIILLFFVSLYPYSIGSGLAANYTYVLSPFILIVLGIKYLFNNYIVITLFR